MRLKLSLEDRKGLESTPRDYDIWFKLAGYKYPLKENQWRKVPRKAILTRDNTTCQKCEQTKSLEIHHILPLVYFGGNETANLITLCSTCHLFAPDNPYYFFYSLNSKVPMFYDNAEVLCKMFVFFCINNPELLKGSSEEIYGRVKAFIRDIWLSILGRIDSDKIIFEKYNIPESKMKECCDIIYKNSSRPNLFNCSSKEIEKALKFGEGARKGFLK